MFAKCLKYELRRSALPFGVLYAAILILSGIAAVTGLSAINPTEALLISALVLGPVAILAYRFYRTMFSKEAAFLLSVPLSSVKQAGVRSLTAAIFSLTSTIVGVGAMLISRGQLSAVIRAMSAGAGVLLFLLIACSIFFAVLQEEALLMISGLYPFRIHQIKWFILFSFAGGALYRVGSYFLGKISSDMIIFGPENGLSVSPQIPQVGLSFPLPSLIGMFILIPLLIILILRLTKRHLMITA